MVEIARVKGFGRVWRCECGAIKAQYGFVTLHLEEEFFLQFANMIGEASSKITDELMNRFFPREVEPKGHSTAE